MKKEKDVQAFVTETIDTAKEQAKNVNRENSKACWNTDRFKKITYAQKV